MLELKYYQLEKELGKEVAIGCYNILATFLNKTRYGHVGTNKIRTKFNKKFIEILAEFNDETKTPDSYDKYMVIKRLDKIKAGAAECTPEGLAPTGPDVQDEFFPEGHVMKTENPSRFSSRTKADAGPSNLPSPVHVSN